MMKRLLIGLITFLAATGIAQAAGDSKEIELIASIIDKYLNNRIDLGEEEALDATGKIAEIKKDTNSPMALTADYLSGNISVSPELLMMATENKAAEAALVYMAIFVRKTATEIRLNPDEMNFYIDNYLRTQALSNSQAAKKWAGQAVEWKKWCNASFQLAKGMPALLISKVSAPVPEGLKKSVENINSITAEDLTKAREMFSARPRPKSLDFPKAMLQKYIDSLPNQQIRKDEAKRVMVVTKLKPYLIQLLSKTPYNGNIKLRHGQYKGAISMANENVFVVSEAGKIKSKSYKWEELPEEQIITLIEYFAQMRIKGTGALVTAKERARHAAQDYLQLAFFLDWYGNYPAALKYMKKALDLSPDVTKDAIFLIKGNQADAKK